MQKRKHALTIIFIYIFFIAFIVFAMSNGEFIVMGKYSKPMDLGIKYSKSDYDEVLRKANISVDPLPTSDNYHPIYLGTQSLNIELLDSEITSVLNTNLSSDFPVSDVQFKCHEYGFEISCYLDTVKLSKNIIQPDIKENLSYLSTGMTLYIKGILYLDANDNLCVTIKLCEVGFIEIAPDFIDEEISKQINSVIKTGFMDEIEPLKLNYLHLSEGRIYLKGAIMTQVKWNTD